MHGHWRRHPLQWVLKNKHSTRVLRGDFNACFSIKLARGPFVVWLAARLVTDTIFSSVISDRNSSMKAICGFIDNFTDDFEKLFARSSKFWKCSYLVLVSPQRRTVWSEDNPHPALLCLHIRSLRKIQCHFYKEEKEEEVRVLHKDASAPPSIPLDWPRNWRFASGFQAVFQI